MSGGEVNTEENLNNNNNENENEININNNNIQKRKGVHYSRFLLQLYHILEDDKYKDIIHWGDNGKYFVIENVHDFTEKILPKYYNHNNYSSFVRQLNMYDFHKKKTNSEVHSFQHSKFIKGEEELIKTINRKRKKDKNKGITSLVPLNTELVKFNDICNLNNINNKIDLQNQSNLNDKHSLSLDEEKENNQFNVDNLEQSLIEYNKKNFYPQNVQLSTMELKKNLMEENTNIKNDKKVTKKSIYDSLNCLFKNIEENSKKQKKLNAKIDSLSNKNMEYINKNKSLLDEIKSKIDYNKKFETIVCFILEIQKIKNEGSLKNFLISNVPSKDNNHLHENQNDNIEIANYQEPKQEINSIIPANDFLQKKTFNNGIIEPFQTFLNKYMEKNKNRGLLTNSEIINNVNMNNINNIINNKNEIINNNDINNKNNNNLLLTNGEEINNQENNKNSNINNTCNNNTCNNNGNNSIIINKENNILNNSNNIFNNSFNLEDKKSRSPSIDFTSSIFHRNRSQSFNSLYSNNTNNFNDNFNTNFFGNNNQNNSIIKSDINNDINNDINFDNNSNKNFDPDFNQDKNSERKDSLNNSSISFLDYKSDKMSDIFGGDNSINFS